MLKSDAVNVTNTIRIKKCFSWSGAFVGALFMVGLNFLLALLAIGFNLSIYPTSANGQLALASGNFIALAILTIIIMFLGGWIAGYLGRPYTPKRNAGELYGFTAWCIALIITIMIASQAGHFIANTSYLVSRDVYIKIGAQEATTTEARPLTPTEQSSLAAVSFATFFLVGLGALSAAFGGHNGMRFRRNEMFED